MVREGKGGGSRRSPGLAGGGPCRVSGVTRLPPRLLKHPSLDLAMEINRSVRAGGEQFEKADDLDQVQHALTSVQNVSDPVEVAALLANRVTRAQGFAEGNKRTALLLARWARSQRV